MTTDYLYQIQLYDDITIERGNIPELKNNPSLLVLYYPDTFNEISKLKSVLLIDPNRLPLPEREFMHDQNELTNIEGLKYRPTASLTRAECNTITGRTKLLEWEQSRPYLDRGKARTGFEMSSPSKFADKNNFDASKLTPQQTIEYIIGVSQNPNNIYNGLWEWNAGRGLLSMATMCAGFHPDLMFANIEGHNITNRDQFRHTVERYAVNVDFNFRQSTSRNDRITLTREQVIDKMLEIYDYCQHLTDCLFATYELFRTEQYETIKDMPLTVRRVAIRNFLSTFRTYNAKSGTNKLYQLHYKGAVAANTRKRLNIPDEVFNYANKTFRTEPLTDPNPKEQTQDANDNPRGAIVSKENRKRTDPVQMKMIFSDYNTDKPLEKLGGKTVKEVLPEIVLTDVERHKLFVNLISAAQRDKTFDIKAIARRVAESTTTNDLDDLTAIPVTVNAPEIIRNVFGKVSPANIEKFEYAIRTLPNEVFIHYPLYKKKTRGGKEVTIRVDSTNVKEIMKQGDKHNKYSPVGYVMPRFGWVGWKFTTKKTDCIINVNAVHYTAMYDENGHLTNYDYFTPQYIEYTNGIDNDVMQYAYPTERLIFKEYDRHFKVATTSVGRAINKAKENNERLTKEQIANIRHNAEIINLNKQKFYEKVLECTNKTPADIDNKKKQRIFKYIEDAMRRMVEYGVLIDSYTSTHDGSAWTIRFVEPNRPSI